MHYGILGQEWGKRRFQNTDGSLTPAGKERYSDSLSNVYDKDEDYDGDYTISKGSSVFRRTDSGKDTDFSNSKYTYTYDYDNSTDDNFYKQFGKKVTEYTLADDVSLAGKKTLGKAFIDKMLSLDDENDIDAMDTLYYESCKRSGEKYVENLFAMPYEPSKHMDTLSKVGSDMVARMLSTPRNEALDAKMTRRGMRDLDTAANDVGRSIVDKLLNNGYSGIRDYNDYGSAAKVTTPTILFNPEQKLNRLKDWIDDED